MRAVRCWGGCAAGGHADHEMWRRTKPIFELLHLGEYSSASWVAGPMPSCLMLRPAKAHQAHPQAPTRPCRRHHHTRELRHRATDRFGAAQEDQRDVARHHSRRHLRRALLQVFRGRALRLKSSRPPRRAGASTYWQRRATCLNSSGNASPSMAPDSRSQRGKWPGQAADAPDTLNKWATSGSDNPRAAAPPIGHSEPSAGRTSRNPPPAGRCPTGSPAGSERRTAGDA